MQTEKRSYLRAEERRRHLLDAAMALFAREGLSGLTMVALAAEAGVSRRLVYEHFDGLEALYRAFFHDRVARYEDFFDRAFRDGHAALLDRVTGVFRRLLEIPADDQRAIRALLFAPGPPELQPLSAAFRQRIINRWLPLLGQHSLDQQTAVALVWALAGAFFSTGALVAEGELELERATLLLRAVVAGAAGSALAALQKPRSEADRNGEAHRPEA